MIVLFIVRLAINSTSNSKLIVILISTVIVQPSDVDIEDELIIITMMIIRVILILAITLLQMIETITLS